MPEEGHGEDVGAGFGDQVTILCVPDPLTRASILSCWSQMASGTDLLLPSLQRRGSGGVKRDWLCLRGL